MSTWVAVWIKTLFGQAPAWPDLNVTDPDLARAQAIRQEQEARLRLLEHEALSLRNRKGGHHEHG